jgi:hypothetical protein
MRNQDENNQDEKRCVRCGYNAQYTWSGLEVCGMGCYKLQMITNKPNKNRDVEFEIMKLLCDNISVQGIQDALDNIIRNGESVKIGATTYSRYYPNHQTWVIELNKYHRDNLLWLFNVIGYPSGNGIEPFTFANTGDWAVDGSIPSGTTSNECS